MVISRTSRNRSAESGATGLKARNARNPGQTIFGYPRDYRGNRYVYISLSPSSRGLAIGINVDPTPPIAPFDIDILRDELTRTLDLLQSGRLVALPAYRNLPPELLELRHVALSGDGEPTVAPHFAETVASVSHVRALRAPAFFRIVLVTDAARFDWESACMAMRQLTAYDEVWIHFDRVASALREDPGGSVRTEERMLGDIVALGSEHPLVVQSLFTLVDGKAPAETEIEAYIRNLRRVLDEGARISRVQIYSVPRGDIVENARHLPLRKLGSIAARVAAATGLPAEAF